jgi:peptide/nickel transport system substrate-binding protein
MRLRRLLFPGLLALAALLGGCGGSSSKSTGSFAVNATPPGSAALSRSPITIARTSDITSLNPQELNISEDYETQQAIYAGLVRPSTNGKSIEGDLASAWTFDPAGLTYTFKLRKDLRFSNGAPITGPDIAFSIKHAEEGPEYGPMFAAISSVSSPTPGEVQIKLSRYSNLVLPGLSFAFVLPRNLDGMKPVDFFKDPVTSGEFSVASWDPNNEMVLKRNPYYWNAGNIYPDEVKLRIIVDENARLNALLAGDAQLDEYVPDEEVPAVPADKLVESKPRSTLVVLLTNNTRPPFSSATDREAAALAINRELILKAIWKGYGLRNQGLNPPGLEDSPPTPAGGEAWGYNPSKAAAILKGTHPPVTLLTSYVRGIDSSLVSALQQELQAAGFHVTTEVRDFASAVTQLLSGNFSLFLAPQGAFLPTVGEPMTSYVTLVAPTAHWNVKEADARLARFSEARTLAERTQQAAAFERWGHSGWLANPIGNPYVFFGVSTNLRGLEIQPFGTYRLGSLQLAH